MNGAESLVHTLLKSRVDTCFGNPGTSEMHYVAALDRVRGMRRAFPPYALIPATP
jgi:acetolactate synthase-1/2/3 large subunit